MAEPVKLNSFRALCLTEAVRQLEAHGPVDDASAVRWARTRGNTSLAARLQWRALHLARTEQLDTAFDAWLSAARWLFWALFFLAFAGGIAAANATLGDGKHPVNLFLALIGMLGLHGASFVIWLLSLRARSELSGNWLGQFWLWLNKRWGRRPHAGLLASAVAMVLARQHSLRWVLGIISHALWLAAFTGLLIALLGLLAARSYTFIWETTLLSPEVFVLLTRLIGWLPAQLGFALPPEEFIRASSGLAIAPGPAAQALWSSWLLGAVLIYGLLPRLLALLYCVIRLAGQLRQARLDIHLPGLETLHARLQPKASTLTDAAPGTESIGLRQASLDQEAAQTSAAKHATTVIAALELGSHHHWPPALPAGLAITDAGVIDTLDQRNALLDHLAAHPADTLLLVCDGQQTPDRGIIHLILDLSQYARLCHIAFSYPQATGTPHPAWQERLQASGFGLEQIHAQLADALAWLNSVHDAH